MAQDLIIQAANIEKSYGAGRSAVRVLRGIDLSVRRGEILSIVGPSGAGKSTLLNIVGCLDGFDTGRLSLIGKDVTSFSVENLATFRNLHMGFIFQMHNLLPEFDAVENIIMPLLIRRVRRREAVKKAMPLLERFGLADRAAHKPGELSGGECQRIAMCRAIIGAPEIILADEPTGNLDSQNSVLLINTLLELGRENSATVIIITHNKEIADMTGRTITLVDGRITKDSVN
ncbi:MAG TPA: ABC transporter ATP-binding protein [Spirochaetota bacterium]|nr:ABC transporter ATP-binding protein [Spirochaetota bacterium]HNT11567.1 ABC transporter ATP-binding protein [Spirochaetota bacterium]HOS41916.1 ABC transporter ATP-binding protein [Spirochaetota bacterium]